ncbi:hypothetical protein SCLCIDRAFT_1220512 [Scleroderma citrinum Foug A]|uniref:Bromodomain associated domain-containing protein n=1 Tax=Scleroderma citrinum Foug A TaxID=1036808 RepID=A0A0C3D663_9AGAM|nr:hypothetical protein SCLCIDRAFT_1220512 [Scleroderma citrinum Foug A]
MASATSSALVDSVVIKILHAHSFARTSSQALSVLSNILARYLALVASACGQYAELAGRSQLSACDIIACLDELGTNIDELNDYCSIEGVDLSRYAASSARRLDDLAEFKGYLAEGLAPCDQVYPPLTPIPSRSQSPTDSAAGSDEPADAWLRRKPSEEFPDFLPPLPDNSQPRPASPAPAPQEPVKMERPPSPLPQHVASATGADYATRVPYADSVLASAPPWHLPGPPPLPASSKTQSVRFPTPSPQQALLSAYHHILTHPVSQVGSANPAKHKVAMALLTQIQGNSRWDAPSTLYGNVVPCPPRVSVISPSYPVSVSTLEDMKAGKDVDEKKCPLPPAPPRAVFSSDKLVFLASQQASRIPELARQVLPGAVLARTTRLTHPPVLQRGSQKLIYGPSISAPWNSSQTGASGQAPKGGDEAMANNQDAPSFSLPDAEMFATWEFEPKHYRDALSGRRGRVVGISHPPKRTSLA